MENSGAPFCLPEPHTETVLLMDTLSCRRNRAVPVWLADRHLVGAWVGRNLLIRSVPSRDMGEAESIDFFD